MKKCCHVLLVLALLFALVYPSYAAQLAGAGSLSGDVYAKYSSQTPWDEAPLTDGAATVVTEGGYTVSVSGAEDSDGLWLRVVEIPASETAVWDWLGGCLGKKLSAKAVFEVYFVDADGVRSNAEGVVVTLSPVPDDVQLCSVTTEGLVRRLEPTRVEKSLQFTADGSNYYVLTQAVPDDAAKTGDAAQPMLWAVVALTSAAALLLCGRKKHTRRA